MGNSQRNSICEVLYAAAWVCGEFSDLLTDPKSTLEAMLRSKVILLPPHIQGIYLQNVLKLYTRVVSEAEAIDDMEVAQAVGQLVMDKMPVFVQSADLEVQERACGLLNLVKQLVKLQAKGDKVSEDLQALFAGELNPVAQRAQKKVPVPEGLDLDQWINEPFSESSSEEEYAGDIFVKNEIRSSMQQNDFSKRYEPTEEELQQKREARKQEQANNPHYLKMSSSKMDENDVLGEIPVTHIDLSVPLHIPGLISSDKYLHYENDFTEKKPRKTKRRRRKGKKSKNVKSESEEDIPPIHEVTILQGEMPEGARSTDDDNDDMNPDDPHRALNIDLEEPLRDDEQLPVRTHHIAMPSALEDENMKNKPKRKHKKEKERKEKRERKEKLRSNEKARLERKNKRSNDKTNTREMIEVSEQNGTIEDTPVSECNNKEISEKNNQEKNMDDINFWLTIDATNKNSDDNSELQPATISSQPPDTLALAEDYSQVDKHVSSPEKTRKKKREKEKHREKRMRKDKKKRERERHSSLLQDDQPKDKTEYEEAPGITTPSKEPGTSIAQTPVTPSLPPASNYRLLGDDENIKLTYETRVLPNVRNEIVVSVIFNNHSSYHLKELEFNVLDTLNIKMNRNADAESHEGIRMPFQLSPGTMNEGQFIFTVENILTAQMLRGTFTYMMMTEIGSTHEKIDFKLHLPVSSYMIGTIYRRDTFAELLSSSELTEKGSLHLDSVGDLEFSHILAKICFHCHFTVVEQVGLSASLYSRSIQDDHICLLVKHLNPNRLGIDGKSTNHQLLSNLLGEIKNVICPSNDTLP